MVVHCAVCAPPPPQLKRRMLQIQVPVCFTYHMHVSMPAAQGSSRVVIYSCAPVAKGDTCVCLCACTLCDGIHNQVTISTVCFTQMKVTGVSPVYFAQVKRTGRAISGVRSVDSAMASHSAVPFEHGEGDDDYLLQGNESYVTNHRHGIALTFSFPAGDHQSTAALLRAKQLVCLRGCDR